MLKILNITSDHNIGGAGRCILTFLEHYNKDKFNIKVVLPTGSALIPHIKETGTECIETSGMTDKSFSVEAVRNLKKIFKSEKPDLVHAHACLSARIAAKLCGIPVVSTRHSVFPNKPSQTKGIGKLIAGAVNNSTSDTIIAVAQAAKDNLTEIGVKDERIIVIKNGVKQLDKYENSRIDNEKLQYGIKKNDFVFAMIARVEDIKGHDYYIEAASKVIQKYDNVKFLICGTGSYLEQLKENAKKYNFGDKVIFTGYITDVTGIMNIINVNVNASYGTEATSLSLLEGMSLGKPIIASRYGGNPELVVDGVNGLLFETKNADQLAEKMISVIVNNELYDELSKGAIKLYNEKYTALINAQNIEDVYLQTIGGGKNG